MTTDHFVVSCRTTGSTLLPFAFGLSPCFGLESPIRTSSFQGRCFFEGSLLATADKFSFVVGGEGKKFVIAEKVGDTFFF